MAIEGENHGGAYSTTYGDRIYKIIIKDNQKVKFVNNFSFKFQHHVFYGFQPMFIEYSHLNRCLTMAVNGSYICVWNH